MNLGAHMSIAGGFDQACLRARDAGVRVMQIFTKNERQWAAKPIADDAVTAWRKAYDECGLSCAFAHASYLINLASPDKDLWKKSVRAFCEELDRCEALMLRFLVVHPGSPGESGADAGTAQMIRALDEALDHSKGYRTRILLETTAGQGAMLGSSFDGLAAIVDNVKAPDRLGVCFDTCHVFAAGYDLRTRATYDDAMANFDGSLGLKRIEAFHLNDSKKDLNCRVDRHEHIGKGHLGVEPFRFLLNDPRFHEHPMVLETPKEGDMDRTNLETLRRLRRKSG